MAYFENTFKEEHAIKSWMKYNYLEYSGPTELAENCAWALKHDQWLDDPDHIIWELAIEFC